MEITVQDVINAIVLPKLSSEATVDKLLFGDPETIVTGISVTFLATQEVIEQSIKLGNNFIITHEGIFYSHIGNTEFLKSDPVFNQKLHLIESNSLSIFRFHDNIHRYQPDGIMAGLLKRLSLDIYEVNRSQTYSIIEIPKKSLLEIIQDIKKSLDIDYIRYMGDLSMECRRVGILVGYRGSGEMIIPLFHKESLDLVIYGEGPEWEAPEYVRDAIRQGNHRALIVLGHAESEKPGMEYVANLIKLKFPSIPVHYIDLEPLFCVY